MKSVLIFVPAYKNMITSTTFESTHAVHSVLRDRGIGVGLASISVPDIDWVRNFALTLWYDKFPQCSHLLFVDDDMGFPPDVVLDMMLFDEPVVGAIYPKKSIEREWALSAVPNPEVRGNFVELEGVGGGCLLIRRDAITTMLEKMPHLSDDRPKRLWGFAKDRGLTRMISAFDRIFEADGGIVSEDIAFGRRWRECGGKVWGAAHHTIIHVGPFHYADSYARWAGEKIASGEAKMEPVPGIPADALLTMPCKHGTYTLLKQDSFIGWSLAEYGEWTEFEVDLMSKLPLEGKTVLDVGANIGTHTLPLSKLVGPKGSVIALEPQPVFMALLERNIQQNGRGNVVVGNLAAGNRNGEVEIAGLPKLGANEPAFNMGGVPLSDGDKWGQPTHGEMIKIDSMALESCALIKIDAEGMEIDILRGAKETIERCEPFLYIEANGDDCTEIAALLEEIGYAAFWSIGPYFNFDNFRRSSKNVWEKEYPGLIPSTNMLAMPVTNSFVTEAFRIGMIPFMSAQDNWKKALDRMSRVYAAE